MRYLGHIRTCAASVVLLALASLPAWAEEAASGEESNLLPQFDVSSFPEQIFWLVVSFATLYVLMAFVALPRIARTQENRQDVITREIDAARKANEDAKESLDAVERSLGDARAKAHAAMSEMLAQVSEEANEQRAGRERELTRNLRRAEGDIARARAAAMEKLEATVDGLARAIVDKILGAQKLVKS